MGLINDLEAYRKANNKSKADMARHFGVPEQNYNNWTYRNSLPKSYIAAAQKLLGRAAPSTSLTPAKREALEILEGLSDEQAALAAKLLRQLTSD